MEMPPDLLNKLAAEVGIKPVSEALTQIDSIIEKESENTEWKDAAKLRNSLFFNLLVSIFRRIYSEMIHPALLKSIQNAFVRYCDSTWLKEYQKDRGLPDFLGVKTRILLTLRKKQGDEIIIKPSDCFYVDEYSPRRYRPVIERKFHRLDISLGVEVEAEEVGARYNVSPGSITQWEGSAPFTSVTNPEGKILVYGVDDESDEEIRNRIYAQDGTTLHPGQEDYYLNVLQSVGGVSKATLDDVDEEGTMYFTIYGETGSVQLEDAQAKLDQMLMATDRAVVSAAGVEHFTLTLTFFGVTQEDFSQSEMDSLIMNHCFDLNPEIGFDQSLLLEIMRAHFPILKGKIIRMTPATKEVPAKKVLSPSIVRIFND